MTGYVEGKHDDPADSQDRLLRIGTKYQATAPAVADGDNVYLLADAAGRLRVTGPSSTAPIAAMPGASEVKTARAFTTSSTTRATLINPTSGKKVRIIAVSMAYDNTTGVIFEVYFGTGANIGTNAGKEIAEAALDIDIDENAFFSWPDGAGPIGAADDDVSIRASGATGNQGTIVTYREE